MKTIKLLTALAAVCALVIGCAKENALNVYDEIQVSSSYVGLSNNEGTNSKTIKLTAKDAWSVNSLPEWLTVSPASGSAGEATLTFAAEKAPATREVSIKVTCAGKVQTIIVKQEAEKVEPKTYNVAEAIELTQQYPDGSPIVRVKGIVCRIQEISVQYGNATLYISDNGKFEDGKWLQAYRCLWLNGAAVKAGDSVDLGDEIILEGVVMSYKGTPETKEKEAYVYQINRSLIKCDSLVFEGAKLKSLPIEGGSFDAILTCKGDGVSVNIPDNAKSWLSVTGIKTSGSTATVSFVAAKNEGGDRTTDLSFETTSEGKKYSASASVAQTGAIIECSIADFNAAPVGETQYRISGIVTKLEQDSEKYGANLYIKDASGETYIYGTTDETGTVKTLASFGAKEGDIVEFVGKRGEHSGKAQMAKAAYQWHKTVTPVTAAEAGALADDNKDDPKNYIKLTGKVTKPANEKNKLDLVNYGNFDLVDDSGAIYVYGVTTGWKGTKGNGAFATLGVEEGDVITIVAYKTSYSGAAQVVGMYVSHEKGGDPEPIEVTEYSIDLPYSGTGKFFDDGVATINGEENQKVLKIGTSSATGTVTFTLPAGTTKVSAYAIAWKGAATTLEFKVADQVIGTQEIAANEGASGNSPYTITVADSDKYEIDLGTALTAETKVTVSTAEGASPRAIFFGVKAE